jgi:hypothetical protein
MGTAHLDDPGFDHRGHLVRTGIGLGALVHQPGDPLVGISTQPAMDGLAGHPVALGHVDDGRSVEDLVHCLQPLLH